MHHIIFVSHCVLNTAAKVVLFEKDDIAEEEKLRLEFLRKATEQGVQLIQLPCPEFTLYGSCRWGHVSNQFDNPFFRDHCRNVLRPYIMQMKEYLAHPERFKILGVVGIDGSPSCGVDYTGTGGWHGSFSGRQDLPAVLASCKLSKKPGIFMDELAKILVEEGLAEAIKLTSLFAAEPDKCLDILEDR